MQRLKSRAKHQKPHPRNDLPYAVALGQVSPSPGLLLAAQDKENGAFDKRGGRGVPSVMSRYRADTPRKRVQDYDFKKWGPPSGHRWQPLILDCAAWLIWGDQPRRHLFNVHSPFAVPLRQRKSSGRLVCMKPAATGHQMAALLHVRCRWGIWDGSIKQIPRSASSSAESRPHGR
jgi:hypothetical protein